MFLICERFFLLSIAKNEKTEIAGSPGITTFAPICPLETLEIGHLSEENRGNADGSKLASANREPRNPGLVLGNKFFLTFSRAGPGNNSLRNEIFDFTSPVEI